MTLQASMGAAEREAYAAGRPCLALRTRVADLETPVAAYLKLTQHQRGDKPNSVLLESIEGGAARGRYSVIAMAPDLVWRCIDGRAEISRDEDGPFVPDPRPVLASLRALIAESRQVLPDGVPPMVGGLFGYLGYDMVRQMERLPSKNHDAIGLPEAVLLRPALFAVFDNVTDALTLAAPIYPRADVTADAAWTAAEQRLAAAEALLDGPLPAAPPRPALPTQAEPRSNMPREEFLGIVRRMKQYIAAGDAFQIVPSQRFSVPFTLPPLALYRALRRVNPAPFLFQLDLGFADTGRFAIVGSSPEILVRLRDGTVTIRPLAGTRPRGATREQDLRLEAELLADPKERAEHLMLLDLGRNDVGRVCQLGSVRVTESFVVERFSHVMHISSTVEGKIRSELDAVDALAAGFPAGTLTGAPKIRAMEIIEELEPTRRGIYAGCIGYFAPDGTLDTCIGLRTAVVKNGTMYVQAGGGVVADSTPEGEYEETRQKSRALFRAAEEAVRFANAGR